MEIRRVETGDIKKLTELSTQLGHKSTIDEMKERLEKIIEDPEQVIFVAKDSGRVLGFVSVVAFWEILSGHQGRVWGLDVDENTQGKGIGRALMDRAEEWAKEQGCVSMKVNSNVMRTGAHKFYEKIGYIKYKEQAIFKKKL